MRQAENDFSHHACICVPPLATAHVLPIWLRCDVSGHDAKVCCSERLTAYPHVANIVFGAWVTLTNAVIIA